MLALDTARCIYCRYPQNLARNTAKHGCPTVYTMVPDSDMIPGPDMAAMLATFLARNDTQQGGPPTQQIFLSIAIADTVI